MVETQLISQFTRKPFEDAIKRSLEDREWKPVPAPAYLLTGAALGSIPYIMSKFGNPPANLLGRTIAMAALGLASPVIANQMIKRHQEKQDISDIINKMVNASNDIQKTSAFGGLKSIGKILGGTAKFTGRGMKELGRGVMMPAFKFKPKTPISDKALSWVSKGLVAGAAYKGGQAFARKTEPRGYTTFLRNQIFAGNIKPAELNEREMKNVVSRGF